jgi:transcriptional regulator with XRE-family HTH domain
MTPIGSKPRLLDVRALRLRLRMSQAVFSGRFGFSLPALRHWERGERWPSGAALALLKVIANNPRAVLTALKAPIPANLQRRRRGGVAATSLAKLPKKHLPPELADTPLQAALEKIRQAEKHTRCGRIKNRVFYQTDPKDHY